MKMNILKKTEDSHNIYIFFKYIHIHSSVKLNLNKLFKVILPMTSLTAIIADIAWLRAASSWESSVVSVSVSISIAVS